MEKRVFSRFGMKETEFGMKEKKRNRENNGDELAKTKEEQYQSKIIEKQTGRKIEK